MSNHQGRAERRAHADRSSTSRDRGAWVRLGVALLSTGSLLAIAHAADAAAPALDSSGNPLNDVIVTAPRQEVKARAVQQAAPNLISVQSAETILKYPDFNAAESLGRMPGVSLSSDTGEGRFVQIRGIDANLDGATYGGIPLMNTNPNGTAAGGGGRAVEFDTIPSGAIDGIIVTYTLLPDHEAEGLGGSIELTPRSAANITKPFLDATLGWGYEPLHDHTGPFEGDLAAGARFGFGDHGLIVQDGSGNEGAPRVGFISNPTPFSFVLDASRKDDRRAIDDLEESYFDDGVAPSNGVSEYSLRRYDYHRRRFSYGGDFEFQPNEDHTYYIRANVAGYTESVHKNILDYEMGADNTSGVGPALTPDPSDPNGYLVTTQPVIQSSDEEETHRNSIFAVGGVDRWGGTVLDYHVAYSRATFYETHDIVGQFSGPTVDFTYDNVSTPNYPIFTFPGGANINNPSLYSLSSLKNEYDVDTDEEFSYAANLVIPAHFLGDDNFKIGAEVRLRDKDASEYDTKYTHLPDITLDETGWSSPALTYYDNHYSVGPEINAVQLANLATGGSLGIKGGGPQFNQGSYIAARENIFAAYAQYTAKIGKWGFLAGVRVEDTNANYGGFIAATDASGNTTNALEWRRVDYTNAFPTVQVRYDFTPSMVARATYSTGISRPGFLQNTTAASVDFSQSPVVITRGNPNLQPTFGENFDLSLEDYLPDGGVISLAAFDKAFTNYIVQRITNGTTTDPLAPGQLANVTTYLNIPKAYARGIEADYHQKFNWLPKPLDGFGVDGNVTVVDSHIIEYTAAQVASEVASSGLTGIPIANESGLLPGTSRLTWNLAGFYEAHGVETRIAAEYVSHSLFGLGGVKALDTIQDDRLTLDWTSSYKLSKIWKVYFNVKNITNDPLRYYEGAADRPIQREFYDATYEAGIRAHF
jgi:TonB-dependent receptor